MQLHDILDLTEGTAAALKSAKILTLEELVAYKDDYSKIRGIGPARAEEISLAMEAHRVGKTERFEPPPEGDPPPIEEDAPPAHHSGAELGDIVLFTSEYGRPRWARLGDLDQDGRAALTVFIAGGGNYAEVDVPFDPNGEPMTWRPDPNRKEK